MFEQLFTDGPAIERYRAAPRLAERRRWLAHLAEAGARPKTLRSHAGHQLQLVCLLGPEAGERVGMARIEAAAEKWAQHDRRRLRPAGHQEFVGRAVRWLRFAGLLEEEPCPPRHAHEEEVGIFAGRMRSERGWSEATIRSCRHVIDRFFDRLGCPGTLLGSVSIDDIDEQVAYWHAGGLSRATIHNYAGHLRSFFRFAESQGWCRVGLADGIMPPRRHPGETIPKGLDRGEVMDLLATTEGDRPVDIRDRAVLMVLIAYGLRAGEVAGLRLDDLDWVEERLQVRRPKPGRIHQYPLSRGVGQAMLRYLQEVRPRRPERALFLSMQAPVRPMTGSAVGLMVGRRAGRIGIADKRRGAHSLRHGTAQHLLDHGLSMKEVGDYLGHRSVSSTAVYAKVQMDTLREVGEIDLGGLT